MYSSSADNHESQSIREDVGPARYFYSLSPSRISSSKRSITTAQPYDMDKLKDLANKAKGATGGGSSTGSSGTTGGARKPGPQDQYINKGRCLQG